VGATAVGLRRDADAGHPAAASAADGPPPDRGAARSPAERMGRMGVSLVVLGAGLQFVSIVLRGVAAQRWPLGNMYEFISAITFAAVVTWLVVLKRGNGLRPVGVFVLFPVVVLQFLGGTVLYTQAAPVMPALQSYWLVVHVTTVSIASGLFFVPGIASILFLLRSYDRLPAALAAKVPSAEALDRLAYRVTIVAFPLYTFAVIAGAIWAEAAWGRFWGWDPKETVAFVAWVIYAAYLHARATAGWRSGGAAWVNVLGLAAVVFNLFFINLVVAGLHSYAGVN
jgi:cytochrome c-type biogenesis protein CcsB